MDIKIIIDTGADMPPELIKKYNFTVLPFMSVFGEKSYKTGVEITNEEFYNLLDASEKIPTTSQTPPGDMLDCFIKETNEHDAVIYFTLSSKGSGQNHTAHMMREEVLEQNPDAKLYIFDSMSYSVYIAQTVIKAAEMAASGSTPEEILDFCGRYIKMWKCFLVVDDLKYLEKGGRINKTTAIVGSLLDIKPVLTIAHGLVEPEDKLRGKKKVLDKLISKIEEYPNFDSEKKQFIIVESDSERGDEAEKKLCEHFGDGCVVLRSEFGAVVGTHVGRGAVAILFATKEPIE